MMQKGQAVLWIVIGVLVLAAAGGAYYLGRPNTPKLKACTMEAKVCPDGSSVGRVGPNCEFAECPTKTNNDFCIQVITPAKNPQTGECKDFSTPCDVPSGWEKVENCEMPCKSDLDCLEDQYCRIIATTLRYCPNNEPNCNAVVGVCVKKEKSEKPLPSTLPNP